LFSVLSRCWFSLRQRALRSLSTKHVATYVNLFVLRIGPFSLQIPADRDV